MNTALKKDIGKKGIITGNTNYHNYKTGDIVTIVGISAVGDDLYRCEGSPHSNQWNVYTSEIEIIEDTPVENENRTGKKYRCIEAGCNFVVGDIVTMIKDDGSSCCLYQSNNGTKAYFMNYKLVPVSDDTPDTKLEINKEQTFNGDSHSTVTTVKKNKLMDKLKKIPNTLKRIIDKDLQAMYKVGFINGDLAITGKGASELMNYLITIPETKKALSDIAKEIIEEAKDNN